MRKLTGLLILAVLIMAPTETMAKEGKYVQEREQFKKEIKAYRQKQVNENKAFRQTLGDIGPEARRSKVIFHREKQFGENLDFGNGIYNKRRSLMEKRLAGSDKLSDAQKNDVRNFAEDMHDNRISFRKNQHAENIGFIEYMGTKADLSKEERKSLLESHRNAQKSEGKSFHDNQQVKRKNFRESLKVQVKEARSGS